MSFLFVFIRIAKNTNLINFMHFNFLNKMNPKPVNKSQPNCFYSLRKYFWYPKNAKYFGYINYPFSLLLLIALNLLCFFWYYLFASYLYFPSYRSFSLLKAIAKGFLLLFAIAFKMEEEQQLSR